MILGLTPLQWLVLGGVAVAGITSVVVLGGVLRAALRFVARKFSIETNAPTIRAVARSIALGIVAELIRTIVPHIDPAFQNMNPFGLWIDAISACFFTIAVYRLADLFCQRAVDHWLRKRPQGRDAARTLTPLIRSAAKVVIVILGFTTVLGVLGVNVAAIITGLSIGGAALALASQDTVKNLFGSAMILTDQPFVVGDLIVVDGVEGFVTEIGFRSTRIRTFADSIVTLPNGRLADLTVDNLGLRSLRRYRTVVTLEHTTEVDVVQKFIEAVRTIIIQHPQTVKDEGRIVVALTDVTAIGFAVTIVMFVDVVAVASEPLFRNEINMEILHAAEHLGVRFAKQGDGATGGGRP